MSLHERLVEEIKAVVLTTLYFAIWFGVLIVFKELLLAEYQIEVRGLSLALVGALVAAKVVLLMEHVPLGQWVRKHAAVFDVILRTLVYAVGVLIVLLLEKAFEARHENGGFSRSLVQVFQHREIHHVWANTIGVTWALLGFNALSVLRRRLGDKQLTQLFFAAPAGAEKDEARRAEIPG